MLFAFAIYIIYTIISFLDSILLWFYKKKNHPSFIFASLFSGFFLCLASGGFFTSLYLLVYGADTVRLYLIGGKENIIPPNLDAIIMIIAFVGTAIFISVYFIVKKWTKDYKLEPIILNREKHINKRLIRIENRLTRLEKRAGIWHELYDGGANPKIND